MKTGECLVLVAALFFVAATEVRAATVVLQPDGVKGQDVWLSSYYSYNDNYGVDDAKLQVGGWGDYYYSLIRFDLSAAPKLATSATLVLQPFNRGDASSPVAMYLYRVNATWDESTGWFTRPSSSFLANLPAPVAGTPYSIDVTGLYNDWQSGKAANFGVELIPTLISNKFNVFRSSDYAVAASRPKLVIVDANSATGPLSFPVEGMTPETAPIVSVFDHSQTASYAKDGVVQAYTGATGRREYGPGELSATPSDQRVDLTWGGPGIVGDPTYSLVTLAGAKPPGCNAGTPLYTGPLRSFSHTGLANGAVYSYRLCIVEKNGDHNSDQNLTVTVGAGGATVKDVHTAECSKNSSGGRFSFGTGGKYAGDTASGGRSYLCYDGHPGIDYKRPYGTALRAAITGTVSYDASIEALCPAATYHALTITSSDDPTLRVDYLHLATYYEPITDQVRYRLSDGTERVCTECPRPGDVVDPSRLEPIGYVGTFSSNPKKPKLCKGIWAGVSAHLHFQVDRLNSSNKWIPVDPYGSSGANDPFTRVPQARLWK